MSAEAVSIDEPEGRGGGGGQEEFGTGLTEDVMGLVWYGEYDL